MTRHKRLSDLLRHGALLAAFVLTACTRYGYGLHDQDARVDDARGAARDGAPTATDGDGAHDELRGDLRLDGLAEDTLAKDGSAEDGSAKDGLGETGRAPDILSPDILSPDTVAADQFTPISRWKKVTSFSSEDFYGVWCGPASTWVVGDNGTIFEIGSGRIDEHTTTTTRSLFAIWGQHDTSILAVGSGPVYEFLGSDWTDMGAPVTDTLRGVWVDGSGTWWMVGVNGDITSRNGATWQSYKKDTINRYAVWGVGGTIWAVGRNGDVQRRIGSGAWIADPSPRSGDLSAHLYGIWGTGGNSVWLVGDTGTIGFYDGTRWAVQDSGTNANLRAILGSSATDVWAVGGSGVILYFNGTNWDPISPSPTTEPLQAICGRSATDVWAVGAGGTVLHFSP